MDCVHYFGDFIIPGYLILVLSSIHFDVTLGRLNGIIIRYSGDFVIPGFHCIKAHTHYKVWKRFGQRLQFSCAINHIGLNSFTKCQSSKL